MLFSCCLWRSGRYGRVSLPGVIDRGLKCKSPVLNATINCGRARWLSQKSTGNDNAPAVGIEDGGHSVEEQTQTIPPSTASPLGPSSAHHSLATFQAHARRTGLSQTSTVYTGTSYEYLTQSTLQPYGFDLHRVGGRGDRGVDLIGLWKIPLLSPNGDWKEASSPASQHGTPIVPTELDGYETQSLRVLVQCKRLVGRHAKIGPHLVRELDGAVRGARSTALFDAMFPRNGLPVDERQETYTDDGQAAKRRIYSSGPAIGVLVSTKPATKGVMDSMRRSTRGLVWVMMEEIRDHSSQASVEEAEEPDELQAQAQDELAPEAETSMSKDPTRPSSDEDTLTPSESTPIDTLIQGRIKQILWNQAARDQGLEDVHAVKRYDSQGDEEVILMRGSRVWGGS